MAKEAIGFERFLDTVEPAHQVFVSDLHAYMIENGCKAKIESKANGYFVSYSRNKRSVFNFLFRKKGMMVRIYGENAGKYQGFLDTLPDEMAMAIQKAGICKRFMDPDVCNPKCSLDYGFMIGGERVVKCGYGCFMFFVNEGNNRFIEEFVRNEIVARG